MEPTRSEKWALRVHRFFRREAYRSTGFVWMRCLVTLLLTLLPVLASLNPRPGLTAFALPLMISVYCVVMVALTQIERRGFIRLLDAKDQEIENLKGQRDAAS
jgi:hypothetical protein